MKKMKRESMRRLSLLLLLTALALPLMKAMPTAAQGLFAPAIKVNDRVITQYEVNQRVLLLRALRNPGNLVETAREQLVEDRLKLDAAANAGLRLSDAQIEAGMAEFAGRADLTLEQLQRSIGAQGVAPETLRDFVRAGLAWRELVRARFGPRSQVAEAEIDRALAATSGAGGVRVLLSEIIMPTPPGEEAAVQARAERLSQITTIGAFAAEARRFSATATRDRGGRLDWLPLSNLPPQLRGVILGLKPGEVTAPLPIPNAIALFQLRAIEETDFAAPDYAAIDYAAFLIPEAGSDRASREAARIVAETDTCDDLYGVAKGLPEERLDRQVLPPADIAQDIAIELAKLDAGEVSLALTRPTADGGPAAQVVLMLCGRTAALNDDVDRGAVANSLRNRKLAAFADSFLAELRADALITGQ